MLYATKACNFAFLCLAFLSLWGRLKPSRSHDRVVCAADADISVNPLVERGSKTSLIAEKYSILGRFGSPGSQTSCKSFVLGNGLTAQKEGSWQL